MRLHIGEAAAEEALRALDRERFDLVGELRAAVVAREGSALDGLVRQKNPLAP